MNKQVLILVAAACTTALWSFVHTSQPMNNQGVQNMTNMTQTLPSKNSTPGSTSMATAPIAQAAMEHFNAISTQPTDTMLPEITQSRALANQYKIHPDIHTQNEQQVRSAYQRGLQAGIIQGLTAAGTYYQAGLTAMAEQIKNMQQQPISR